jgi:cytochrome c-type biogenesis protein
MGGLLSLAFAAGMVAPVNPCGFALLPAWISQTLCDADASPVPVRLLRALRSGIALAIGFAGTLAAAGLLVSAGARGLIQAAPKLGLAVGVLLVLLGLWMLAGRSISVRLPRITGRATEGLPPTARMLVFGIGYALASLSCTFGVILAVIAQAQATASYAGLLLVFGVYAAGSASILLLLALATTAAGTGLTRHVARLGSYGPRITGAVLLLTGVYLAWYWWPAATADNNLVATGRAGGVARLSTTLSGWVQAHTAPIAALAVISLLVVLAHGAAHRRRRASSESPEACCDTTNVGLGVSGGDHEGQ